MKTRVPERAGKNRLPHAIAGPWVHGETVELEGGRRSLWNLMGQCVSIGAACGRAGASPPEERYSSEH